MSNVHQMFEVMAKTHPASLPRLYTVTIWIGEKTETVTILAFTTCDAIVKAIDLHFDGDQPMPSAGLEIKAEPFDYFPRAA